MKSMTGYARVIDTVKNTTYFLEIKSVNHKYLNISFSLPSLFSSFEHRALPVIRERVKRGSLLLKTDFHGDYESDLIRPDVDLAKAYYKAFMEIGKELNIDSADVGIREIFGFKELFRTELPGEKEEEIWEGFEKTLEKALEVYDESRKIEGEKLKAYLEEQLGRLGEIIETMHGYEEENRERYRQILTEGVKGLSNLEMDPERIEQEIILTIQRSDIGEELSRSRAHISRAGELMGSEGAIGSELDFLFQEMGREMNTLSNKSKIPEVLNLVVEGKTLIKRLREQVQNVE